VTTPFAQVTAAQVASYTLVVVPVAGCFWLAHRFSAALFTLFAAMVLGTAVRPGLDWIHRRGISRRLSAILLYAALCAVIVSAAVAVVPVASAQATALGGQAPRYLDGVRTSLASSPSATVRRLALELPVISAATTLDGGTVAELADLARIAFAVTAVLLLGFSWSFEGEVTVRSLLRFAPLDRRDAVRALVEAAEERVGGYVRGQLIVSSVTTVLSLAAFLAIGLPNALVLALVAGALGAVPFVGGPLAAGVALLGAAAQPHLVPWIVGAAVGIHALQEYVVAPRVMGQRVGVHPFTILLAISGFGSLLGIAGAVLAIPMAAIIQVLLDRFVFDTSHEDQPALASTRRGRRSVLSLEARTLALDARRQARDREEGANEQLDEAKNMVESIAHDLDRILTAHAGTP
jgi:predicted PurR-regulated permease PerM